MYGRGGRAIFVGNLPGDVREREVEDLFMKFGRITHIDLKTPPRPPAYAFVEFDDPRDADDAVRGRDGYDFYGNRLRVEVARGNRSPDPPVLPAFSYRGKGSGYRVLVKRLPPSASWQDLKDHFRKVVKPNYVNVYKDRGAYIGVVEFDSREDLRLAIRRLDDSEFRNPFDRAYIRVIDDSAPEPRRPRARSYSRSRSRSRGRSLSRSPSYYSRSPSHSRSPSRSRSASRGPSRSRSLSGPPVERRGSSENPIEEGKGESAD